MPRRSLREAARCVAQGKADEAIQDLKRAVALNPLPEYLWALADSLRIAGRADEARSVEDDLNRRGAASDPRSYALYLATRGEHVEVALELIGRELKAREDVFTLDAFAWSLAAGRARGSSAFAHSARARRRHRGCATVLSRRRDCCEGQPESRSAPLAEEGFCDKADASAV